MATYTITIPNLSLKTLFTLPTFCLASLVNIRSKG